MGVSFFFLSGDTRFLGSSSLRPADEASSLRLIPARPAGEPVSFSGRDFSLTDQGLSMVLMGPAWMAGAEAGVNSAGVAIAQSSVYSRFKAAADGVPGADLLRAALMASACAEEARDALIMLTETMDQGWRDPYTRDKPSSSSYLITAADGSYLLETAGRRWAWSNVAERAALSGAYTLGVDYKRVDADTRKAIAPVNERMACLDESDAGRIAKKEAWKRYVEGRLPMPVKKAEGLGKAILSVLPSATEGGRQAAFALLRAHGLSTEDSPKRGVDVCPHVGWPQKTSATGSLLVERTGNRLIVWFTAAPWPCRNLYKPIVLTSGAFTPLWTGCPFDEGNAQAEDYWRSRKLHAPAGMNSEALDVAKAQAEVNQITDDYAEGRVELEAARISLCARVKRWDSGESSD